METIIVYYGEEQLEVTGIYQAPEEDKHGITIYPAGFEIRKIVWNKNYNENKVKQLEVTDLLMENNSFDRILEAVMNEISQ